MFMISTSNRFAVLGKNNVKKTYLAAAICGLVKEKERKAAMRADRTLADNDGDTAASYYVKNAPTEEAKAQLRALLA